MPVEQVAATARRERARRPPPPFTTSTMQQEGSAKLGLSPARTMAAAQQLYEGPEEAGGACPTSVWLLSLSAVPCLAHLAGRLVLVAAVLWRPSEQHVISGDLKM